MQLSPFGEMPLVEITEKSTMNMDISVDPGWEVNVSINWVIDCGEVIDNTHWCWLETIRDHGKYLCKECRENGETKSFDSAEELYLDHFNSIIEAANQAVQLGYVFTHVGREWNAVRLPASVDEQCNDGWVKLSIGEIKLLPLKARKGRHKHARAIHALIATHTGLKGE